MIVRPLGVTLLLLTSLLVADPALASCGAEGQRPCLVTERIPSCDVNLTEASGTCWRPDCGREGQRGCGPTERVVFDFVLRVPVPQVCDVNLKHDLFRNVCEHPACGREGERACTVFERVPSCDVDLVEQRGSCVRPACGRLGEPVCQQRVAATFSGGTCDANLVPNLATRLCQRPGQHAGQHAAQPVGQLPGQPTGQHAAQPIGQPPGQPTGQPPAPPTNGNPPPPPPSAVPPPPPPARAGAPAPLLPAVASGGTSVPPGAAPPLPPGPVAGTAPPPPALPPSAPAAAAPSAAAAAPVIGPVVSSSGNGVTLSAPTTVLLGQSIDVDWMGPSRTQDYIVLAYPGTPPGLSESIAYRGTRNSPVNLRTPRAPGPLEIWYLDDARKQILHRVTVTIVAPAAAPAAAASAAPSATNGVTLSAPATVRLGQWITVDWTGPGRSQDYIVLAAPGTAPGLGESIAYGGARNTPVSLRPPRAPGPYEIWYLDDARKQILHRETVTITP